jgi:acetyl/propionyl-CoA carboxylase alpha subunit
MAIARMQRALAETVLTGFTHNASFHRAVLAHPRFLSGDYTTHFIDDHHAELMAPPVTDLDVLQIVGALLVHRRRGHAQPAAGAAPPASVWKLRGRTGLR